VGLRSHTALQGNKNGLTMSKLKTYVHVRDESGQNFVFGPDDNIPAWAEKAITNPNVWADVPAEKAPAKQRVAKKNSDTE
jgi:hypothetical protein